MIYDISSRVSFSSHVTEFLALVIAALALLAACGLFSPAFAGQKGGLRVISFLPDETEANLERITVRFSEPMRALGVLEEEAASAPLRLEAQGISLSGVFRWQDPSTLTFVLDAPIAVPASIRACVPAGTTALSGATLPLDECRTLNTPPLVIECPSEDEHLPPNGATLYIHSNYPLRLDDLQSRTRLLMNRKALPISIRTYGEGKDSLGRTVNWQYRIAVESQLPRDAALQLAVDAGIRLESGPGTGGKFSFALKSYPSLKLEEWRMDTEQGDGKSRKKAPESALVLRFSTPVALKDVLAHVSVSPEADVPISEEDDDGAFRRVSGNSSHYLPYRWKPRTKYTVTIRKGLTDVHGGVLAKDERFSFTTGDYYPFFSMDNTGIRFLERSLGGMFPILARNLAPITVRLRYVPWDSPDAVETFTKISSQRSSEEFLKIQGAVETTTVLDFGNQANSNVLHMLDLPKMLGLSGADEVRGEIAMLVTVPRPRNRQYNDRKTDSYSAYLQITNLGITAKAGRDDGLIWVTHLDSGRPVEGAEVSVLSRGGERLWDGRSDEEGVARLPGVLKNDDSTLIMVRHQGDSIAVRGSSGRIYTNYSDARGQWNAHMVSQLPLYQPGQEVRFVLYAAQVAQQDGEKRLDPVDWLPLGNEKLTILVYDSRGREIWKGEALSNVYGSVSGSFTLGESAPSGQYRVSVSAESMNGETSSYPFQVASFRPPDFKVDLTLPADQPTPDGNAPPEQGKAGTAGDSDGSAGGLEEAARNAASNVPPGSSGAKGAAAGGTSPLSGEIRASYFSGAGLPEGEVLVEVAGTPGYFSPERLQGYSVGFSHHPYPLYRDMSVYPGWERRDESLARFSGRLDAEGYMAFTLPRLPIVPGKPKTIRVLASVTDASGLVTQGDGSFLLHPSSVYVGLRAPYVAARDQDVAVGLKAATWKNGLFTGVEVRLVAERITYRSDKDERVWEKTVTLSRPEGDTVQVRFEKGGLYRLTAIIRDEQGLENHSNAYVHVSGGDFVHYGGERRNLELLPDNAEYSPGQTARIIVKNPFEKAQALIAMERSGVRKTWVRELEGEMPIIEVAIEEKDAPYVFVSVVLVKGRTAPPPDTAGGGAGPFLDEGAPAVASATVCLPVKGRQTGLALSVSTDAKEYRPGAPVKADVRVTDLDGKPQKAQVTLLAVDERILRAAGERTNYDPRGTFRPLQAYGLWAKDTRTMLLDLSMRIADVVTAAAEAVVGAPQAMMSRSMSKDASMDGDGGGETRLRGNFDPMAFWLAEGETDGAGNLHAEFGLPDTLTGYRIVAVAAGKESCFAVAEESIKVNSPLQILSALPRFATGGDALEARFLVQNTGTEAGSITVTVSAQGLELERTTAAITLEPGRSGLVGFPAKVLLPGAAENDAPGSSGAGGRKEATATITVAAVMGEERDSAIFTLPVMPPQPLTTVAAAGMIKQGQEVTLPVQIGARPNGVLDPRSRLDVILAASPAAGLSLTADTVLRYPWGCLEQRLSRAWVRGIRLMHGALLGLPSDDKDREILQAVMSSIQDFQRYNGGFALWQGAADADVYLTAYVLLVDAQLRPLQVSLGEQSRRDALGFLSQSLGEGLSRKGGKESEDNWNYVRDIEALVLWALAEHKAESARTLFPTVMKRMETSRTASPLGYGALLLAARALPDLPDREKYTAAILKRLEAYKAITATEMHFAPRDERYHWFTMGSSLRDNALLLAALCRMEEEYPNLEALALWVSRGLADRNACLTTQEGVFGLWGLTEYLKQLEGDAGTEIRATWNNKESITRNFERLVDPASTWTLPSGALEESLAGAASPMQFLLQLAALKGSPHWTARLVYAVPSLPPKAENMGFGVDRSWTRPGTSRKEAARPVQPSGGGHDIGGDFAARGAQGSSVASNAQTPHSWRVGDIVEVRLNIRVDENRRHALVFDPIPAGFEPVHATRVDLAAEYRSWQYPWQWEDVRNDGVLLYTRNLPPGVHTYTYRLRAATPGVFVHRAARAEEMYAPEVFGRTSVGSVEIGE